MLVIYSLEVPYLLPPTTLISHHVNFPDCIVAFSYQDGGERPGFSLRLAGWLRKAKAVIGGLSRLCTGAPDSQLVLSLCLNYKSQSCNGQGWHLDIFKKSKRPDLNGNQFHCTNLGFLLQAFSYVFCRLIWDFHDHQRIISVILLLLLAIKAQPYFLFQSQNGKVAF